jgi:phage portal protein BeeE
MPYIKLFEYEFNRKLVLPSERKFIEVNLDETYMLHGDKQSTANYYQTLVSSGILSINEAREQLGFQPVEGGDENMVLYSKTTDNMVSNNEQDDE